MCAWRTPDQGLAPIPMRRGAVAIKQTGSRQQHGAGADGPDSPNSSSDGFQPADHSRAYFVILNRATARYQQGVNVSTQLAKRFMRHDSQSTVRNKRSVRGSSHDFYGIDWRRARILSEEHFRGASKDLQRSDQIEDFGAGRGHENDSARCVGSVMSTCHLSLIKSHKLFPSVFTNLSGAASNVFLSSSEQK